MLSNVGGVAYGTITIGAVLAAESAARETYPETLGAAPPLLVLALCWSAGTALSTAVDAATWTAAGSLVLIEMVVGSGTD